MKNDAKFEKELTCALKNDIRNLVNFHVSSRKSKKLHFHGFVLSRYIKFAMKKYRRVMSHDITLLYLLKEKLILEKYAFFV